MSIVAILLNTINLILLIGIWAYAFKYYRQLPQTIPVHFDFDGKPDGYGNKKLFWVLPGLALILYAGLRVADMYPETGNYLVEVTDENREFQYGLASAFTQAMTFAINALCFCVQEHIVKLQKDREANSRIAYWVFIILIFFLTMAFIIVSASVK